METMLETWKQELEETIQEINQMEQSDSADVSRFFRSIGIRPNHEVSYYNTMLAQKDRLIRLIGK